jgi:hypothetical protein
MLKRNYGSPALDELERQAVAIKISDVFDKNGNFKPEQT